ncbi:hypothetical protein QE429_000793 [Bacillus sp. SORGH_AS 510]|nr:hypothetical protein [Bacillus sp. SORGH_AS_0510]
MQKNPQLLTTHHFTRISEKAPGILPISAHIHDNNGINSGGEGLNRHVERIAQILQTLTETSPAYKNPIGFRLTPLLLEMDWAIQHINHLLQQQTNHKDHLKPYISVLYRADEAADPLIHGWERAAKWMESPEYPEIVKRRELYHFLREELKSLVPYVEKIFGKEEARFIIPPLFRG